MSALEAEKISAQDLEDKFVELQTNIDHAADSAKDVTKKLGLVALVVLLILMFLLGRRRGSASRTVVEIRRV